MGKKKDKKGKHTHVYTQHFDGMPPQMAGLAAAALKQVNTPAFQQTIAGALAAAGKAMEAMAQRSAAERAGGPVPPTPPTQPTPPEPPFAPEARAYRPHFETRMADLPPEAAEAIERVAHQAAQAIERAAEHAAHAIETAAAGFEKWVERKARPGTQGDQTPGS